MKKIITLLFVASALAACSDDDKGPETKLITVGFENVPASILAVNAKGSNFYSDYDGEQYTEYTDEESGLYFGINKRSGESDAVDFWNGGIVFSTWNTDLTTNSYENQCTVNYVDANTKNGGNKGSKAFAVVNSAYDIYAEENYGAQFTEISFPAGEENLIDHLWAMNTVYTTLVMEEGNGFGDPLSYENEGYFYVTMTGYNANGNKTGSVDFYLADFRTEDSPGIIDKWTKVDLTKLGKVNKVQFTFGGSDVDEIQGLNTPRYCCIDDIAVIKEIENN